ncbi:MAG TPA: HAD family hydrolase [Baekduia sp.]
MTPSFDTSRPRPVPTVLDALRTRIDHSAFDAAVFWLETVASDLGYGDIRALPGSVAWIDALRAEGKRTVLISSGERAEAAANLAGIGDRFDVVLSGARAAATYTRALEPVEVEPARTVVIDAVPAGIGAARDAGIGFTIAVARDGASAEQLRRSGADTVVADLQELLAATR